MVISSIPWGVSVCEWGAGDKAVVGEEDAESTIFIQKWKAIYECNWK